jgi:hypothetical protein
LEKEEASIHPFIMGELALGRLKNRSQFLHDLQLLPEMHTALDSEILNWIEKFHLYGKGINWVDAHLLFSCFSEQCEFWTRDKALLVVSSSIGVKTHSTR